MIDEDEPDNGWSVWCGARRTDEQTTAIGYYRWYPTISEDNPDETHLEFRPLLTGLRHNEAELLAHYLAADMQGSMEQLRWLTERINGMNAGERSAFVNERRTLDAPQVITPDFDR